MGTLSVARTTLIALLVTTACSSDGWRYRPFPDAASLDTTTDAVDAPPGDVPLVDVPTAPDSAADVTDAPDIGDVTDAPDVTDPPDVSDASDAPDVAPIDVSDAPPPDAPAPDIPDVPTVDAPPPPLRVLRGGVTTVGALTNSALRVTGSLESAHRICTPDRSLCVTGGIAP